MKSSWILMKLSSICSADLQDSLIYLWSGFRMQLKFFFTGTWDLVVCILAFCYDSISSIDVTASTLLVLMIVSIDSWLFIVGTFFTCNGVIGLIISTFPTYVLLSNRIICDVSMTTKTVILLAASILTTTTKSGIEISSGKQSVSRVKASWHSLI